VRLVAKVSNDDIEYLIANYPQGGDRPEFLQYLFAGPLDVRLEEEWRPPFSATLVNAETVTIRRSIQPDDEMRLFRNIDNPAVSFIKMHAERRRPMAVRPTSGEAN